MLPFFTSFIHLLQLIHQSKLNRETGVNNATVVVTFLLRWAQAHATLYFCSKVASSLLIFKRTKDSVFSFRKSRWEDKKAEPF